MDNQELSMMDKIRNMAKKAGLHIVENPPSNYIKQPNDIIIITPENLNVANPPLDFSGVPKVDMGNSASQMIKQMAIKQGFNIVENPDQNYVKKPNDFVFVTLSTQSEMSGDSMSDYFKGIPTLTDVIHNVNSTRQVNEPSLTSKPQSNNNLKK